MCRCIIDKFLIPAIRFGYVLIASIKLVIYLSTYLPECCFPHPRHALRPLDSRRYPRVLPHNSRSASTNTSSHGCDRDDRDDDHHCC